MRKTVIPAALILVIAGGTAAYPQDYRTFRSERAGIQEQARWRIGPLRISPALRFYNLGYDSNVYFRQADGEPQSDYTGIISPEVKLYWLAGHSLILSFPENPEYVYYRSQKELRSFTNSFAPAFRWLLFNRFSLSGEYHYQHRTRRGSSEFVRLVDDTREGYQASFFIETPRETALGFTGLVDDIRFTDIEIPGGVYSLAQSLNHKERSGTLEFYYRLISDGDFFIKAGYAEYEFQHAASSWRNAYSYQAYSGMRFPFAGRARGRISFGYKRFMPRTAGRKGFSGLVADTQMEFRLNHFNFRAGYVRDNRFSIYSDMYYFIEDRFDAGISFYLFPRLRLDYDFRQGRLDYPEAWAAEQPDGGVRMFKRKDTQRSHAIGLMIRLFGNTGLGIQYSLFDWRSDLPGYTIKRQMVGANLTYDF